MTNDEGAVPEADLGDGGEEPALVTMQRDLTMSAGYRAIALVDRVKRMSYLLQGNVSQYLGLVARLQDPGFSLPIFDVRNPDAHDDLLSEAERLLHNVLTAMSTRVDHQRAFMEKHFADDPLLAEYEARTGTFKTDLSAVFLKGLRNYIAHRQLPVAQSRQTFTGNIIAITFVLPSAPLLEWDRWPGVVREWMKAAGEDVMIVDTVTTYARVAADFDTWLMDRIKAKYATEIAEFDVARQRYNQEHARVFGL